MDMHVRHPRLQVTGREKGTIKGEGYIMRAAFEPNFYTTANDVPYSQSTDTRIRVVRYSDSSTLHSALTDVEGPTSAN
ncbi:hypothetical protein CVT26_003804 [Gymnopilus dilepis]|uniref:Uncharacterized protein n=1 Tax=Gymnopilus dilepis TaxID=231916 RepID=A0A409W1M8_9AGAR|nr:hypothetical protein CVT26_003804 [Gymnopilus dilepis]